MICLSVNRHACNCLLILLFLLCSVKGQNITLDYVTTSTSCANGDLLEGKDTIILNGTVDLQNASSVDWRLDIPIEHWIDSVNRFDSVCIVSESNFCFDNGTGCYYTSKKGNKYTLTITKAANKTYSNGTFRAQLTTTNLVVLKNDTARIPVIHGIGETCSSAAHSGASNSGADYELCIMYTILSLVYVFFS